MNRKVPIKLFEDAAFSIPSDSTILRVSWRWWSGKTSLAQELFRLSERRADPSYSFIKPAFLTPQRVSDPRAFPVQIRNRFARAGVSFPAFDYAFAVIWQKVASEEALPTFENAWLHRISDAASGIFSDVVKITPDLIERSMSALPGMDYLLGKGGRWFIDRTKIGLAEV